MIKVGDRVKFISETSVGKVTRIEGSTVYVDVEEGFEIPTFINELVAVNEQEELEAMERIGYGDNKPGRKKGVQKPKTEEKKRPSSKEPAFKKYGKVAIMDTYEDEETVVDEDDNFIFDVHDMKERYLKDLEMKRLRESEFEKKAEAVRVEKERTTLQSKFIVKEERQKEEPKESKQKEEPKESKQKEEPKEVKPINEKLEEAMMEKKEETPTSDIECDRRGPDGLEVIDLHAEEILESTEGLCSGEIITAQLARYAFTLDTLKSSNTHGKIVFIHGVGKGRLKYEMLQILKKSYPKMDYQDASFKEYGYGAIIIYY